MPKPLMSKRYSREAFVNQMRHYLGASGNNALHKEIVDTYNSYLPHPRGFALTMNSAWCAATVSAASIALQYTDITPIECSCTRIIEQAKKMGIWVEDDAYVPSPGDWVVYDWEDNGKGDCVGTPNHIGCVEVVNTEKMRVIEGNYNDVCQTRILAINGRYIRGFVCPKYDSSVSPEKIYYTVKPGDTLGRIAKRYNTTPEAIQALNPDKIKDINMIRVGWKIRVK